MCVGGFGLLTAVVEDQLLEAAELGAGCDVEAPAVQLADLVVLHVQPFGVVIVQHRQTVRPFRHRTEEEEEEEAEEEEEEEEEEERGLLDQQG